MIAIPQIDGLTKAEDFDEIEDMARSYISVATDTPIDDIGVRIVGDTKVLLELIEDLKDRLSVRERTGETVTPAELKADLGLDGA
jgi:hypothetical protein